MSKIGKTPVIIPEGVNISIEQGIIYVSGPKGKLEYSFPKEVLIEKKESKLNFVLLDSDYMNYWGLVRSLVNNMIEGVTKGYEIKLLILGVGFTAKVLGDKLELNLGLSHPVIYNIRKGISVNVDKDPKGNPLLVVTGIDKQLVGQTAAQIRDLKRPEPYKGKGIRYLDETVKIKAGKTAKK